MSVFAGRWHRRLSPADGTVVWLLQLGQAIRLPAVPSGALSVCLHCGHENLIAMGGFSIE
jgi:hypothetical protein